MARIKQLLQAEQGANQILTLGIIMGALVVVVIFFDFGSVHYARRTAQTGSDAAVLAAAKDYAIALSNPPSPLPPEWVGFCGEIEPATVSRYVGYVHTVAGSQIGLPSAHAYAATNKNQVVAYRSWASSQRYKIVSGVPVPFVNVYTKTNKDIHLVLQEHYGQEFKAPAEAYAEVYLSSFRLRTIPCRLGDATLRLNLYRFYWKIRLIKAP